jgi:spore photoproduct lyase
MALPREILDIQTIYMEPAVDAYDRGGQVLAHYPNARRVLVRHITTSRLYGNEGNAEDWLHQATYPGTSASGRA